MARMMRHLCAERSIDIPDVCIAICQPLMEDQITIQLNGRPHRTAHGATVTSLLSELGFAAQPVLVERNGTALFPRDFEGTLLNDGDALEVIRIVAGG